MKKLNHFKKLYLELRKKHGRPQGQWALWCKRPKSQREKEEILLGAILTQNTGWKNVGLALKNLKRGKIDSLKKIYQIRLRTLETIVRPAGFYKSKARYLFNLAEFVIKNYGSLKKMEIVETSELRKQIVGIKGVGPETADSLLLYGLHKPSFVIDEYTRRLVKARGLARDLSYGFLKILFEENIKKDFRLYQDFHALIVIAGQKS